MPQHNGVNKTQVHVIWCPPCSDERGVLQITVRLGKRLGVREHLAFQSLLASIKKLQDTVRWT
jgi:sulfur relay (sulfurtransferase) complex TusBCD TusD component (DsrE family)